MRYLDTKRKSRQDRVNSLEAVSVASTFEIISRDIPEGLPLAHELELARVAFASTFESLHVGLDVRSMPDVMRQLDEAILLYGASLMVRGFELGQKSVNESVRS